MTINNTFTKFLSKYRDVVLFNKNLLISASAGFFSAAYVSQLYAQYDNSKLTNAIVALLTEYLVYIPFFLILFYVDNRHRYRDPITGKRDIALMKQDIKKLAIAFSTSETIYAVTRISTQYQFLQFTTEPYQASMASSLISWAVFFVLINAIGKMVKLFRKQE